MRSEDRPSRRLEAERKPDGVGAARDRQPQSPAVSLGSWHLSGQQRYGHRPAESDVVLPGVRQRGRQVVAGTQQPLLDGILHGGPEPNESSLDAL